MQVKFHALPAFVAFLFFFSACLFVLEFLGSSPAREKSFVQRVVDGDTLVLASGERLRLIGIDAPENGTRCFEESGLFLQQLVSGKEIWLEFDVEKRDKYGRLLAFVFDGNRFVNLEMVNGGYAVAFPFEPNTMHAEEFAAAEQQARGLGKGCLWKLV